MFAFDLPTIKSLARIPILYNVQIEHIHAES